MSPKITVFCLLILSLSFVGLSPFKQVSPSQGQTEIVLQDYATQELNDPWDFEDNDGWINYQTSYFPTASNGKLYTEDSDNATGILTIKDINAHEYYLFEVYFVSNETITSIQLHEVGQSICLDSSGWTANEWHTFNCDLSLDSDWDNYEDRIHLSFYKASATGFNVTMDYILLNREYEVITTPQTVDYKQNTFWDLVRNGFNSFLPLVGVGVLIVLFLIVWKRSVN